MVELMSNKFAAAATACPWFPEEYATTPRALAIESSWTNRLNAPRNLNEPVICSGSAFTRSRPPICLLSDCDSISGVFMLFPTKRLSAAHTSAKVGKGSLILKLQSFLFAWGSFIIFSTRQEQ